MIAKANVKNIGNRTTFICSSNHLMIQQPTVMNIGDRLQIKVAVLNYDRSDSYGRKTVKAAGIMEKEEDDNIIKKILSQKLAVMATQILLSLMQKMDVALFDGLSINDIDEGERHKILIRLCKINVVKQMIAIRTIRRKTIFGLIYNKARFKEWRWTQRC